MRNNIFIFAALCQLNFAAICFGLYSHHQHNQRERLMKCVNSTDATDFECDSCAFAVYGENARIEEEWADMTSHGTKNEIAQAIINQQ